MDWFPWYPDLYKADTMHLDPYQDGCYRRLIDHYMTTRQPLPDNDAALARIIGDSVSHWHAMACAIVRAFFTPKNGRLHHKKCDEILAEQDRRAKNMSEIGRNGAKKRWGKINKLDSEGIAHAIADPIAPPMPQDKTVVVDTNVSPTPPYNTPQKIKPPPAQTDADFESFWSGWRPYDMDKGSKANARKAYDKARKETDHETIVRKRDQYLDECHHHGRRTTHASTWLNPTGRRGWADDYEAGSDQNGAGNRRPGGSGKSSVEQLYDLVLSDRTYDHLRTPQQRN